MEIEYSNEVRGKVYAYRFENWERMIIAKAFRKHVKALEKSIDKIKNHPKNEGQATYSVKIDSLRREIKSVQNIIDIMESNKTT